MLALKCFITLMLAWSLWYLLRASLASRYLRSSAGGEFPDYMDAYQHNISGAFCTLSLLIVFLFFLGMPSGAPRPSAALIVVHSVFAVALFIFVGTSRFSPFTARFAVRHRSLIRSALGCLVVAAPTGLWLLWV